ncbi:MAG: 50S ribosomal protein L34 [Planctomycetes bacterium]|nr:50S ribosomal protein L34 [Planctomycetota bacterium]
MKKPRCSYIKRKRQCGFRSRMKTKGGRAMINRRRTKGRRLPSV